MDGFSFSYHMFHCAALSQDECIPQVWGLWRTEIANQNYTSWRLRAGTHKIQRWTTAGLARGSLHSISLWFHYNLLRCSFKQLPAALAAASWLHTMLTVIPLPHWTLQGANLNTLQHSPPPPQYTPALTPSSPLHTHTHTYTTDDCTVVWSEPQ